MEFKQFYLGCLAQASYLIGDAGEAAVVDPRRDVNVYLDEARARGLTIRHVIETHLHADFVSGHRELAARTGARIYFGARAGAAFDHVPVRANMPNPDLSTVRAVIAHDRADVRNLLTERLRELGVEHIDAVGASVGGSQIVALMTTPADAAPKGEPLPAGVSRFSHDVASPLMCVLALSGLLVREGRADAQTREDLKRIQAAAEEIAVMVRTLGEQAGPRSGRTSRPS